MTATITTAGRQTPLPGSVRVPVKRAPSRPGVHFYQGGELYHVGADGVAVPGRLG